MGQTRWIGCVRFKKKSTINFFAPQVTRMTLGGGFSHEFCRPKPKLRKRTKHEFWVKRGGLGEFVSKISTACFFAPQVARTALGGGFRTSFVDRNRNFENAPHMSFGSNGVDWVRSFVKNQLQVFFAPLVARTVPRGRVLHEFCRPKPKLRKRT